jgi:hypothetical protein
MLLLFLLPDSTPTLMSCIVGSSFSLDGKIIRSTLRDKKKIFCQDVKDGREKSDQRITPPDNVIDSEILSTALKSFCRRSVSWGLRRSDTAVTAVAMCVGKCGAFSCDSIS